VRGFQLTLAINHPTWLVRPLGYDGGEGEGYVVWAPDRERAIEASGFEPEQIEYCELDPE
jgi:hypothetical protein